MANKDSDKLKILLEHWVEHNNEHSEELRDWAGKAKAFGDTEVAALMLQAAQEMGKSAEFLGQALKKLGG